MTELAIRDDHAAVAVVGTPIAAWAESARQAANVAVSLAKTPFVPASLRDRDPGVTAANITAAILTGQELGLEPMAALRSIDVISGTPALRAMALRAVVLAAGHDMWLAESTQTRAIVQGRRKGSDQVQESVWTIDRAKALGLAGKDNWRKQPGAMLVARATAECARLIAADAILGVPYVAEELADDGPQIVPADAGPAPQQRTARRRSTPPPAQSARPPVQRAEPEPEPDFDEPAGLDEFHPDTTSNPEPEPAQPTLDTPDPITKAQAAKLHATFAAFRITDRDERLRVVAKLIGREVGSSNDLTKQEASTLIDTLESILEHHDPRGDLDAIVGMAATDE